MGFCFCVFFARLQKGHFLGRKCKPPDYPRERNSAPKIVVQIGPRRKKKQSIREEIKIQFPAV